MKKAFIYGIKNNKNNLYYIGQTINRHTRKWRHFNDLEKGAHPNRHLQNSFNKNGKESFSFEILERVEDYSQVKEREDYWIEKLGHYNIDRGRSGFTPTALRNMSEAQLGKVSSRRLLDKEDVFVFLSVEEFVGNFGRTFSRLYGCNRIVPRGILEGITYQDHAQEYIELSLQERVDILTGSLAVTKLPMQRFTEKTASVIWYLYKDKGMCKKEISRLLRRHIRSVERVLGKETLKGSYEVYSGLSEEILEVILEIVIDNTVPSLTKWGRCRDYPVREYLHSETLCEEALDFWRQPEDDIVQHWAFISVVIDEVILVDGEQFSQVILPMMNVSRRAANGKVDPNDRMNKSQIFITSAG